MSPTSRTYVDLEHRLMLEKQETNSTRTRLLLSMVQLGNVWEELQPRGLRAYLKLPVRR